MTNSDATTCGMLQLAIPDKMSDKVAAQFWVSLLQPSFASDVPCIYMKTELKLQPDMSAM